MVLKKTKLTSLRIRIMLYTIIPVSVVLLAAGIIMTNVVRFMIDLISRQEISGSTELASSRTIAMLDDYTNIAENKSEKDSIRRFLATASERDEMEDNAYFSYAMGELDSAISDYSHLIDRVWVASAVHSGVAFSNTSAGWIAADDFDVRECFYYNNLLASGETWITDMYRSDISDDVVVTAASLVRDPKNNAVLGVFAVDIKVTTLWQRIYTMGGMAGSSIIIESGDGYVIYHNNVKKVAHKIDEIGFSKMGPDGIVERYTDNGKLMIGMEATLKNCGWVIYAVKSYDNATEMIATCTKLTIFIFSAVGLIMLLALSIAASKIASPIQNYTRLINTLNLSDDSAVNTDNDEILQPQGCTELEHLAIGFNALIERNNEMVRRLHRMNIESEQARLLYQTALQSSSDVVFEYDIESDSLTTYGSALDSSVPKTYASVFDGFLCNIREEKIFSAADIDYAEKFLGGDITGEMILAQQDEDGTVHWLSFEGTPVFSENKAVKAVGTIRCIDDVMTLKENAERDLLSGFYNKATTESIIANKLSRTSGSSAVILIDIDNFKSINDIFGHSRGDYVIKDIASKIGRVVDNNAVAGRIGGDEFMLYLPSASREKTEQICSALCESIRFTYTSESGEGGVDVSASIGAAICPENGSTFEELYGCADIAMYTSKTGGKNRFTLYSGQERPEYKGAER